MIRHVILMFPMSILMMGCSHSVEVEGFISGNFFRSYSANKATESSDALEKVENFKFIMGQGSGLDGYDTVVISSDGKAVLFRDTSLTRQQQWHVVKFTVESTVLAKFTALLTQGGLLELNSFYDVEEVQDGSQWFLKLKCDEGRKIVYCNNHFPKAVREISSFINEFILTQEVLAQKSKQIADPESTWIELTEGGETSWIDN